MRVFSFLGGLTDLADQLNEKHIKANLFLLPADYRDNIIRGHIIFITTDLEFSTHSGFFNVLLCMSISSNKVLSLEQS